MKKPKKSDFDTSTARGRERYNRAVAAWKRTQPKVKKPSWTERLDAQRTASDKERKSRNPEQLKVSYNKKTRKVERKVVPNPNYKRPTKGQKGYSPDASSVKKHEVDMEAIRKTVKNLSNKKDKNSNSTNKASGNGGSKVTNKETNTTSQPKEAWRTKAAEDWLKKTRNSPAAKLRTHGKPTFSDKERWELQQKHRAWKAKRGR